MRKYRKRPVVIEAVQWHGSLEGIEDICRWANDGADEPNIDFITHDSAPLVPVEVLAHTLEGPLAVSKGDWIIKGVKGEFYPCKPDIFEATYEEVV